MQTRLLWWLTVCISLLITGAAAQAGYAQAILSTDWTYISLGILALYLLMTTWIGWCVHSGQDFPIRWASFLIDELPQYGLIGTVLGFIVIFGLNQSATTIDESAVLGGLGTALFTTLLGTVYARFLALQLRVLGHDEA